MITADDASPIAAAFEQRGHAMKTDIGEGFELSLTIAQDDDGLSGKLEHQAVSGSRRVACCVSR